MIWGGPLARSGKVKGQTPHVEPSSEKKQSNGRKKFRVKSSTNVQYKSGANRIDSKHTDAYLTNSYHKFNTFNGVSRVEDQFEKLDPRTGYPEARNHKKWHRNHRVLDDGEVGVYTCRSLFDETITKEEE